VGHSVSVLLRGGHGYLKTHGLSLAGFEEATSRMLVKAADYEDIDGELRYEPNI
jgi:hypothetical protein